MLCNRIRLVTLARRTLEKATMVAAEVMDTTLGEAHMEVPATRILTVTERSPDMEGRQNRRALESSRPETGRLASTQRSVRARSTICPTDLTLKMTKILSCCQSITRRDMPTRRRHTSKLWATTERRLTTETARPRISRQRILESMSRYWQTQDQTTPLYRAVLWRTQGSEASLSRSKCCRSPSCLTWLSGAKATSRSAAQKRCSCRR
jgi:hypothetical protein